jgi:CheY-like chemotaxis protein
VELSEPIGPQAALAVPVILDQIESSDLAVSLVPDRLARLHLVVPISVDNRVLKYATFKPLSPEADHDLGFASGRRTIAVVATRAAVVAALDRYYPKQSDLDVLAQRLRAGGERLGSSGKQAESAAIDMCNQIIGRAVDVGAAEVQMACDDGGATIRYRIRGTFESEVTLPVTVADAIRDRLKILARVGVAVRNRPQTGAFRLILKGKPTAVSLSTNPTVAGETIVLRMPDQAPPLAAGTGSTKPGRSRVLIVDDEPITRMLVKLLLERDGFTVFEAQNGDEAIATAAREHPDLVLLDLNMPVMDGYEAIHHLRHNPSLARLPIIVLTSEDGPTVERRVLAMGANDYMIKPFEAVILLSRVHAVFNRISIMAVADAG